MATRQFPDSTKPYIAISREWLVVSAIAMLWLLFTAGVYLPDIGRGFIKDDFRWVLDGTAAVQHPMRSFLTGWEGNFFRPVVALTFGVDHALYGLWARGYGLTNLALYAVCVVLVFALLRQLGFSPLASAGGAFAWAVNPSGLDMAVLWLSGRSSLLMTVFSTAAIIAALRGHRAAACLLFAGALFSKEDALPIPLLIVAAKACEGRPRREWITDLVALGAMAALYLDLRAATSAITAANAPDFYRLTWNPALILENTLQYLDRAATSTAVLATMILLGSRRTIAWKSLNPAMVRLVIIWFIVGICITVRIPVRSSLYVVFASVSAAILFALLLESLRSSTEGVRIDGYILAAFTFVLLLIPAYGLRNDRWVEPARVAGRTLRALEQSRSELRSAQSIVFVDEAAHFSNFESSLGGAEEPALQMMLGRSLHGRVVPAASTLAENEAAVQLSHGAVLVRAAHE